VGNEDLEATFAETGLHTGTGARLRRVCDYLDSDRFMLTYGDGNGAVDLHALVRWHIDRQRIGTVTGVRLSSRYGEMQVSPTAATVTEFNEKPTLEACWVSGGFFMFDRVFIDKYLTSDPSLLLEIDPLQRLARDGQLTLYPHEGFWMGMDNAGTGRSSTDCGTKSSRPVGCGRNRPLT
jgi:glucose-1-phosphate cytidylyltransferase